MNENCTIRLCINSKDFVIASKILRRFGYSMDEYLHLAIKKLVNKKKKLNL